MGPAPNANRWPGAVPKAFTGYYRCRWAWPRPEAGGDAGEGPAAGRLGKYANDNLSATSVQRQYEAGEQYDTLVDDLCLAVGRRPYRGQLAADLKHRVDFTETIHQLVALVTHRRSNWPTS